MKYSAPIIWTALFCSLARAVPDVKPDNITVSVQVHEFPSFPLEFIPGVDHPTNEDLYYPEDFYRDISHSISRSIFRMAELVKKNDVQFSAFDTIRASLERKLDEATLVVRRSAHRTEGLGLMLNMFSFMYRAFFQGSVSNKGCEEDEESFDCPLTEAYEIQLTVVKLRIEGEHYTRSGYEFQNKLQFAKRKIFLVEEEVEAFYTPSVEKRQEYEEIMAISNVLITDMETVMGYY